LREVYHIDTVDFAVVYDSGSSSQLNLFTKETFPFYLASVLPIAQINQYLGSLFIFDSHAHLERFVADNMNYYQVWPPAWYFAQGDQNAFIMNEVIDRYFKKWGTIPSLSCRQFLVDWAQNFYREHVFPQIPVTVQIRNNPSSEPHRNSNMESWLQFFHFCKDKYPVKFIVVCSISEVDPRLRECPNVILAKDHHTGIEQDLVLIQTAAIHTGASSGPSAVAMFNSKPYLIVNMDLDPHKPFRGLVRDGPFLRYNFAAPLQRYAKGTETVELLVEEFAKMWASVDATHWYMPKDSGSKPGDGLFTSCIR